MPDPIVEIRNLSYSYPDGHEALRDLNLSVAVGESIGLVGPNGAGKSTFLLHLNGVLPEHTRRTALAPTDGAVRIGGLPIDAHNLCAIRQKVGLVFQDPDDQLFCPSVIEDVAFGPLNLGLSPADARKRASEALASVELVGFEDRVPHHLSVGERKRVCLAGVLACRPELLALDEPTSGLDPRSRRHFIELVATLPGARVIATHDLEMVLDLCSRVIILDEGRLCDDGPTRDILRQEDVLLRHGLEVPLRLKLESST